MLAKISRPGATGDDATGRRALRACPEAIIMMYQQADSMDNKYFKIAVILVLTSFVLVSLVFVVVLLLLRSPSLPGK
jgi:hypothetical protein